MAGGRGVTQSLNDSFLPVTIIASAIHAGSYNSRSLPFCGKLRLTACQLEALGGGGGGGGGGGWVKYAYAYACCVPWYGFRVDLDVGPFPLVPVPVLVPFPNLLLCSYDAQSVPVPGSRSLVHVPVPFPNSQ